MCFARRDKFDPNHPTCRSCQRQEVPCQAPSRGRKKRVGRQQHSSGFVEKDGAMVLVCQTDLRSPNDWNNSLHAHKIYAGEKRKWVRLFRNAFYIWKEQTPGIRRRLSVTRLVPNRRYLIKDFGNRVFTLKPIEDALKQAGVIIDDSEDYLDSRPPEQVVDPSLPEPVVEIRLDDIVDEPPPQGVPVRREKEKS